MQERPFEFRTAMILWTLLGLVVSFTIHFILLSTPSYNWFALAAGS